ncbi:MAG TPA: hypothetical protein VFB08_13745 [Burkholderiales bacterium]|nr:hypothetical protein [Burkholderiales bacterium]
MTDLVLDHVGRRQSVAAAVDDWCDRARPGELATQGRALARLMRSGERWQPRLFPAALAIARTPGSGVNLGAMLSALSELPVAGDTHPWPFDPAVNRAAFDALSYAEASAGIARTQRANREGWYAHADRHRALILDAAAMTRGHRLAVVLGAGKAFDLPLAELAQRFERVIAVDIDAQALDATLAAVVKNPALRRRIVPVAMDVSGVSAYLARGIEGAIGSSADGETARSRIAELCASYRLLRAPKLVPQGERADLLVSGMVLTQLALQAKLGAHERYVRRFGELPPEAATRWAWAWDELDLRMQQDHVNALLDDADLAVLSSDVAQHCLPLPGQRPTESWLTAGSDTLAERLPGYVVPLWRARWSWPRIAPRPPTHHGVRSDVDGLILRLQRPR